MQSASFKLVTISSVLQFNRQRDSQHPAERMKLSFIPVLLLKKICRICYDHRASRAQGNISTQDASHKVTDECVCVGATLGFSSLTVQTHCQLNTSSFKLLYTPTHTWKVAKKAEKAHHGFLILFNQPFQWQQAGYGRLQYFKFDSDFFHFTTVVKEN